MPDSPTEIIRLVNVSKGLYDLNGQTLNRHNLVLSQVNFSLEQGEVHVLLGENGAGKSSLVKMICGAIRPDSGQIFINGKEMTANDPQQALASGVATVSQEFSLCPNLTVAENISLGRTKYNFAGFLDFPAMRALATHQLNRLGAGQIDVNRKVKHLPVAEQQLVEIAKALAANPQVLILDEPTSTLTDNQVEILFRVIHALKDSGVSMIYITHKLKEIFEVGDRVTVLRDGRSMRTVAVAESGNIDDLIQLMIGSKLDNLFNKGKHQVGETALEVLDLKSDPASPALNLTVKQGEIVGVAGIVGAGRTEFIRRIFGIDSYHSGSVTVFGKSLPKGNPQAAIQAGIGFIPEDRKRQGIVPCLAVRENICHVTMRQLSRLGWVSIASRSRLARTYVERLKVMASSLRQEIRYLSGGNQQKAILGKWLSANARILIFDEPTRGIDVITKSAIYRLMVELADRGVAILMISSELQEVVGMSDRVYVMRSNRIAKILAGEEINGETILRYAMGGDEVA
ncbi:MAG: sugar ABC transporter ATP-binding protein [Planctomycetota bacterium]|jgi:ribose transport system ATP-binding protein|nr:sugar ABC transporter ATP-binding protein [Planctomycetota bacterium]